MPADDFKSEPIQPNKLPHEIAAAILQMPVKFGAGEAKFEDYLKDRIPAVVVALLVPQKRTEKIAKEEFRLALHQVLIDISQGKTGNMGILEKAVPFIGAQIADMQNSAAHDFSTTASPDKVNEFTKSMKKSGDPNYTDEDTRSFHTQHGYDDQKQAQYMTAIQSALIDLKQAVRNSIKR